MIRKTIPCVVFALIAAVALPVSAQNNGPAPTMNIVSPTAAGGTLFLGSFPTTVPVNYTVTMNGGSELKSLVNLNVLVNGVSLYGSDSGLNAFGNGNVCTGTASTSPNTCSTTDAYNATLSVPWTVNGVGTYTILVAAKYRGADGIDQETVTVAQMSAEYPAPPAVANAYLRNHPALRLSGKQHGCVISKIAEQHAHYSAYGPKGGPYVTAAIQAAVDSFASSCPR